ncbi:MAG: sulfur oxidation c-type cytochrome SoxX [Loktanella sp.]|nr:sulfur oxidation c-type cytochrome SoxX [Loktanella sp.]
MKTALKMSAVLAACCVALPATAQEVSSEKLDAVIEAAFANASADVKNRIYQDETQAVCSKYRDNPPDELWDAVLEREQANIAYPESDVLMGDWQVAMKEANNGYGWRIGDDKPGRVVGGNCYACHQLAPDEVAYGNLGPSLTGYGKDRVIDDQLIKATYDKIYNAQAVLPCSQMPRFGANGFLTPEQVADYVAMLLSPDSPVNE